MTKLSNLTKVTTVGDDALFYIVDPARSAGDRSVGMDKDDVQVLVGGGGGGATPVYRTGTTVKFDAKEIHQNLQAPLEAGNLTLDLTDAVENSVNNVYCYLYEPTISGAKYLKTAGDSDSATLNILSFLYNGSYVDLKIANVDLLIAPTLTLEAGDTTMIVRWLSIANADNYVIERSEDNFVTAGTQVYSGGLLEFTDTGLTNGTTYYYRAISQGNGFLDSLNGDIVSDTPAQNVFAAELVASYSLNADATDYTGNNDGTETSMSYIPAIVSNGGDFNGTTSKIVIPSSNDFLAGDGVSDVPYSISLWIKRSTGFGSKNILARGLSQKSMELFMDFTRLRWRIFDTGSTSIQIDIPFSNFPVNTWRHVVFTYDGSANASGLKAYVNKVLTGTTAGGSYNKNISVAEPMVIGVDANDTASTYWNGDLDEIHFWKNRELTQAEVNTIYDTEFAGNSILV